MANVVKKGLGLGVGTAGRGNSSCKGGKPRIRRSLPCSRGRKRARVSEIPWGKVGGEVVGNKGREVMSYRPW